MKQWRSRHCTNLLPTTQPPPRSWLDYLKASIERDSLLRGQSLCRDKGGRSKRAQGPERGRKRARESGKKMRERDYARPQSCPPLTALR